MVRTSAVFLSDQYATIKMPRRVIHVRAHGQLLNETLPASGEAMTTVVTLGADGTQIPSDRWTHTIAHSIYHFCCNHPAASIDKIVRDISKEYEIEHGIFVERLFELYRQSKATPRYSNARQWLEVVKAEPDAKQELLAWIQSNREGIRKAVCDDDTVLLKNVCSKVKAAALHAQTPNQAVSSQTELEANPSNLRLQIVSPLQISVRRHDVPNVLLTFQSSQNQEFNTIKYCDGNSTVRQHMVTDENKPPPLWLQNRSERLDQGENAHLIRITLGNLLSAFREAMRLGPETEICVVLESCLSEQCRRHKRKRNISRSPSPPLRDAFVFR